MKQIIKFLGPIIMLIGVIVLASYKLGSQTNAKLVAGLVIIIIGLITHVIINKRINK